MADRLRVGVLGLTHDHIWHHVADLAGSQAITVVAVADEHEDLVRRFSEAVPVERTYGRVEEALERERLDLVMVYADNRQSAALAKQAMSQGAHVMVEKPMASRLDEADAMLAAAADAGVRLMVNWPVAWYPAFRHALNLTRDGHIGRVTQVDYRSAHNGPKEYGCSPYFYDWLYDAERNGGGALIDYCCYGVMAAYMLLGLPHRVHAVGGRYQKDYIRVEDNALLTMTYPRALGMAQASWSQIGEGLGIGPIIYGTEGTILVHQRHGSREGQLIKEGTIELMTRDRPQGQLIDPPALSADQSSALGHFVTCLRDGTPLDRMVDPTTGRAVQEVIEAGYLSLAAGKDISLPLAPGAHAR
jgi:predicted dehydrogenase